ncbi:MAG: hypothetical protein ACI8S6_000542 [Myxococcota bacterium]|jgi:hypothetical protein
MKIPEAARPRFDRLLTLPLETVAVQKRALRALDAALEEAGAGPTALSAAQLGATLLDRLERKTSPLYVRLIHGAVHFLTHDLPEDIRQADWALRREVTWAVAHSTKNFDLVRFDPNKI